MFQADRISDANFLSALKICLVTDSVVERLNQVVEDWVEKLHNEFWPVDASSIYILVDHHKSVH